MSVTMTVLGANLIWKNGFVKIETSHFYRIVIMQITQMFILKTRIEVSLLKVFLSLFSLLLFRIEGVGPGNFRKVFGKMQLWLSKWEPTWFCTNVAIWWGAKDAPDGPPNIGSHSHFLNNLCLQSDTQWRMLNSRGKGEGNFDAKTSYLRVMLLSSDFESKTSRAAMCLVRKCHNRLVYNVSNPTIHRVHVKEDKNLKQCSYCRFCRNYVSQLVPPCCT